MSLPPPRRPLKSRSLRRRRTEAPPRTSVVEDDAPSIGKLARGLLKLLIVFGVLGGFIWFYFKGLKETANTSLNLNSGLKAVAAELWENGLSVEIPDMDPDLTRILIQLKTKLQGSHPSVVVTNDEETAGVGSRPTTHQILYTLGMRSVLALTVDYDPGRGKIEILSYQLGSDYQDLMKDHKVNRANPAPDDHPERKGL